jgi:hypothetical protein
VMRPSKARGSAAACWNIFEILDVGEEKSSFI